MKTAFIHTEIYSQFKLREMQSKTIWRNYFSYETGKNPSLTIHAGREAVG